MQSRHSKLYCLCSRDIQNFIVCAIATFKTLLFVQSRHSKLYCLCSRAIRNFLVCVSLLGLRSYILWSVLLHHLICIAPLLELIAPLLELIAPLLEINCTIGVVLRQCFSILFEFQVIRKGCIFFTFFAICTFISSLLLHSFSNYIVALRDDR